MNATSLQQLRLRHFQAMGGPCDLAVFDAPDSLLDRLEAEVMRLEQRYSRYRPGSLVSAINQDAGTQQAIDEECAGLLNYADQCYRLSEGLFDITAGVLRRAWISNVRKFRTQSNWQRSASRLAGTESTGTGNNYDWNPEWS